MFTFRFSSSLWIFLPSKGLHWLSGAPGLKSLDIKAFFPEVKAAGSWSNSSLTCNVKLRMTRIILLAAECFRGLHMATFTSCLSLMIFWILKSRAAQHCDSNRNLSFNKDWAAVVVRCQDLADTLWQHLCISLSDEGTGGSCHRIATEMNKFLCIFRDAVIYWWNIC